MRSYAITDRHALQGPLLDAVARLLAAGLDLLQIREKDLGGAALWELACAVRALANPRRTRILLNGRADIALAAGLDGVHLPAGGPPPAAFRPILPAGFLIGVSTHSVAEAVAAERDGADFVVFGPVFDTPSKRAYGPPLGLERLGAAAAAVDLPLFALGGVSLDNAASCLRAGAAGIAAVSLFQNAADPEAAVAALSRLR